MYTPVNAGWTWASRLEGRIPFVRDQMTDCEMMVHTSVTWFNVQWKGRVMLRCNNEGCHEDKYGVFKDCLSLASMA